MPTLTGKRRSIESVKSPVRKKAGVKRVVPTPVKRGSIDPAHVYEVIVSVGKLKGQSDSLRSKKVASLRKIVSVPVVTISEGRHGGREKAAHKPAIDNWVIERINKSSSAGAPILKKK